MNCLVCRRTPCDPAHLISYKVCLEDKEENMIPLCRSCHTVQHQMGLKAFVALYKLPIDTSGIYPCKIKP